MDQQCYGKVRRVTWYTVLGKIVYYVQKLISQSIKCGIQRSACDSVVVMVIVCYQGVQQSGVEKCEQLNHALYRCPVWLKQRSWLVDTYVFICVKEALLKRYKSIQVDLLILIDLSLLGQIFTELAPLGRFSHRVAMSGCLSVCLRHRVQFFLGLSLALRFLSELALKIKVPIQTYLFCV